MSRERLPNRRGQDVSDFTFSREEHGFGLSYTLAIGRYEDGRIAEVFLDCHKLASHAMDEARDAAIVLSLALQHATPLDLVRHALSRFADGRPCTLIGRMLDVVAEMEAARTGTPPPDS